MPRVFRTAFERESLLAAYRASGLKPKVFAEREHIPLSTFCQWLARSSPLRTGPRFARLIRAAPAFDVPIAPRAPVTPLVIELGVARVRVDPGFDKHLLVGVLDILEPRCRRKVT
jgi:hypothetical protein